MFRKLLLNYRQVFRLSSPKPPIPKVKRLAMPTDIDADIAATYGLSQRNPISASKLIEDFSLRTFPEGPAHICGALYVGWLRLRVSLPCSRPPLTGGNTSPLLISSGKCTPADGNGGGPSSCTSLHDS